MDDSNEVLAAAHLIVWFKSKSDSSVKLSADANETLAAFLAPAPQRLTRPARQLSHTSASPRSSCSLRGTLAGKIISKGDDHPCLVCNRVYSIYNSWYTHMRTKHPEEMAALGCKNQKMLKLLKNHPDSPANGPGLLSPSNDPPNATSRCDGGADKGLNNGAVSPSSIAEFEEDFFQEPELVSPPLSRRRKRDDIDQISSPPTHWTKRTRHSSNALPISPFHMPPLLSLQKGSDFLCGKDSAILVEAHRSRIKQPTFPASSLFSKSSASVLLSPMAVSPPSSKAVITPVAKRQEEMGNLKKKVAFGPVSFAL